MLWMRMEFYKDDRAHASNGGKNFWGFSIPTILMDDYSCNCGDNCLCDELVGSPHSPEILFRIKSLFPDPQGKALQRADKRIKEKAQIL